MKKKRLFMLIYLLINNLKAQNQNLEGKFEQTITKLKTEAFSKSSQQTQQPGLDDSIPIIKYVLNLKSLNFQIPDPKLKKNRQLIGSSYKVDYIKNSNSGEERDTYTPILSFFTIFSDGIFNSSLDKKWKDLDHYTTRDYTFEIFYENPSSEITAFNMNHNSNFLSIALKNLDFLIFDLEKKNSKENFKILKFSEMNISRFEQGSIFESIASIPYSDFLISSFSRFDLVKIGKLDGSVEFFDNPLDEIQKFAVVNEIDYSGNSPQVHQSHFIGTSKYSSINFIGDYTTMKPIYFFSISLFISKNNLFFLKFFSKKFPKIKIIF